MFLWQFECGGDVRRLQVLAQFPEYESTARLLQIVILLYRKLMLNKSNVINAITQYNKKIGEVVYTR